MPVKSLNLYAFPEECEYNCGPATAQMITKGGFIQPKSCPTPTCWFTSPAELAIQVNNGGLAGYSAIAFGETPAGAAAYKATAAILHSIRSNQPAAAAIHSANHWVACDAFSYQPPGADGTFFVTGISFLDPEVIGPREDRPFGIVFEQRQVVWIETWFTSEMTPLDNARPECSADNNKVHIVVALPGAAPDFMPVRIPPKPASALLDETAVRSRVETALTPHRDDLAEIFGLPAPVGWSLKKVTLVLDELNDARWARIHLATGKSDRELVVVTSTRPPLNDADGLCLRCAGILIPSPGGVPSLPGAMNFRRLLESKAAEKGGLPAVLKEKWIRLLNDPVLTPVIDEVLIEKQGRSLLQPHYRLKLGGHSLFISPRGELSDSPPLPPNQMPGA